MTWMLTRTGFHLDLRHIRPLDIDVEDIAHALAQLNRFNGMASRPYSVAEHSLFVERLVADSGVTDPNVLQAALMHDAHEAYFGDITAPMKQMLNEATGGALKLEERRVQMAVMKAFKLQTPFHTAARVIHWADMTALSSERFALMPEHPVVWPCTEEFPRVLWRDFDAVAEFDWAFWRDVFLRRFTDLQHEREALAAAVPFHEPP